MTDLGKIEFESSDIIALMQQNRLSDTMQYVAQHSAYYKKIFSENKIDADSFRLENITQLPFTTKDDLAKYNDDFLCVPKNKVADFITTSGTLSDPVTFYLTARDLDRLAYNEAVSLQCASGSENDIFQLMTTIDKLFMAGIAYFLGIQKLNAGCVRVGPGTPHAQWEYIHRFSPTTLIAIPSFIPKLIEYAVEHNISYKNTSVKKIICLGEPVRNADFSLNELGKRIVSQWDVNLYSTYASTEMGSAFTECEFGKGGHSHPELLILEVVDEYGKPVADGVLGEVVVTTLGVEGMPLLRYKTGDLCHVHYTTCSCGRNTTRLGPVMGRKQQMIKYKGTTLFPQAIFNVLNMIKEIDLYQVEISKDEFGNDNVNVMLSDKIHTEHFDAQLNSLFKSKLRVTPRFIFIDEQQLYNRIYKQDKRKPEKIIYI